MRPTPPAFQPDGAGAMQGSTAMRIDTTRFGTLQIDERELFQFPQGLIGMETLHHWLLRPDPQNPRVAWLQSASVDHRALAVVSPRAFVPDYRVRVGRRAIQPLQLRPGDRTYVLTTLSGSAGALSTNLRAPVLINLDRRLGCQVITEDEQAIQHPLSASVVWRAAA